jgi:hypothetical protein
MGVALPRSIPFHSRAEDALTMTQNLIAWAAVGLLLVTSTGLLLSRDWRWTLGLLAAQYVGMFLLITQHWPFGLASVKLVTGWMASAALGVTRLGLADREETAETAWPQGWPFRLFASAIAVLLAASATPAMETMIPGINRPVVAGGLILAGMGLLHLGITADILRVSIGLLTLLAGFEIVYSTVETSILLTGLLAIANLGLALVGSYLMTARRAAEEETQ